MGSPFETWIVARAINAATITATTAVTMNLIDSLLRSILRLELARYIQGVIASRPISRGPHPHAALHQYRV